MTHRGFGTHPAKRLRPKKANESRPGFAKGMNSGLLDTNVAIHSLANEPLSVECSNFMKLLESGVVSVVLDATVLHELSYSISRYRKDFARADIARLLLWLVDLVGVSCDRPLFQDALQRWGSSTELGLSTRIWLPEPQGKGCLSIPKT
jgi:hypothetical protein